MLGLGIERSLAWLAADQKAEGYWVGAVESNSCMEAEWILAMHVLGVHDDPKLPGVVQAILNQQREDGAWEVYQGLKAAISTRPWSATRPSAPPARTPNPAPARGPGLDPAAQWDEPPAELHEILARPDWGMALERDAHASPELIYLPLGCRSTSTSSPPGPVARSSR